MDISRRSFGKIALGTMAACTGCLSRGTWVKDPSAIGSASASESTSAPASGDASASASCGTSGCLASTVDTVIGGAWRVAGFKTDGALSDSGLGDRLVVEDGTVSRIASDGTVLHTMEPTFENGWLSVTRDDGVEFDGISVDESAYGWALTGSKEAVTIVPYFRGIWDCTESSASGEVVDRYYAIITPHLAYYFEYGNPEAIAVLPWDWISDGTTVEDGATYDMVYTENGYIATGPDGTIYTAVRYLDGDWTIKESDDSKNAIHVENDVVTDAGEGTGSCSVDWVSGIRGDVAKCGASYYDPDKGYFVDYTFEIAITSEDEYTFTDADGEEFTYTRTSSAGK